MSAPSDTQRDDLDSKIDRRRTWDFYLVHIALRGYKREDSWWPLAGSAQGPLLNGRREGMMYRSLLFNNIIICYCLLEVVTDIVCVNARGCRPRITLRSPHFKCRSGSCGSSNAISLQRQGVSTATAWAPRGKPKSGERCAHASYQRSKSAVGTHLCQP